MESNKNIFKRAYDAFEPSPNDATENVPFYRTWRGLSAVLKKYGYGDPFTAPIDVHGICSWATKNGDWSEIVRVLPMHAPKEPKRRYARTFYCHEPSPPTEKDVKAIFDAQYKERFPGQRLNSKHARDLWKKLKPNAMALAVEDYKEEKAVFDKAVAAHEAALEKEERVWQDELARHAETIGLIEKLKTE